jgi:hypothetical protein
MIAARRKRHPPRGPVPLIDLNRGDVAQRGDHVGVVAACSQARVLVWPVRWRDAERAADITIAGWLDRIALGSPRRAMVQASVLLDVPREGQRLLGRFTDELLLLIERAAARDAVATATIRRWSADYDHRRRECVPPPVAL